MDQGILQGVVVVLIVAGAACFVAARVYRALRAARARANGCGGDCCH